MMGEHDEDLVVSPTSDETLSDIRKLSIRCRDILHQLSADDGSVDGPETRELMANFNIWAANMGVFREGQQSLASRLKSAPQISDLVQQLLVALKRDLEKGSMQGDGQERNSSTSESEDSSDRSSTSSYRLLSPSDDDEVPSSPPPRSAIWTSIQGTVTSLRQLALTVRLAGGRHRQERIERFKNLDRNKQVYQVVEKCARQMIDFRFPKASEPLRERMAESIATRRVRFLYLEQHQKKTSTLNEPAPALQQIEVPEDEGKPLPTVQQGQQQAPIVVTHQGNFGPAVQPSVMLSATDRTKLDLKQLQTLQNNEKRAESVSSVKISMGTLPHRPKLDPGGTSFTCPYCFLICPAKEASGESQWMSHLIADFEPFFCVYDDCSSPFTCADTYSGWLAHMRDTHTQPEWHCWHCKTGRQFSNSAELETHLEMHHQKEVTDSLRPTLVKHSMVHDQPALQDCPFCGGYPEEIEKDHPDRNCNKAREALEKHVRDHLVSVSMILAPAETGEAGGEFDDTQSEAQRGNDSERILDGLTETYDPDCRNDSCDCKESEKNSVLDWSADPGHRAGEVEDMQMVIQLWQEIWDEKARHQREDETLLNFAAKFRRNSSRIEHTGGEFTPGQCEAAMSAHFKGIEERGKELSPDDIETIQDILCKAGKPTWSARPRTYAVLRMINRVNLMDELVKQGLLDHNFPYSIDLIPIEVKPQSARDEFFEKQSLILTEIKAAENGKHASLAMSPTQHFTNIQILGSGGQGVVHRVTSKLSLRDYARKAMFRSRKFEGSGDGERALANELQNLKKLSHRHLVQYVGSYTDPTVFAILLLPVADMDLKTFLSQDPFPEGELSSVREYFGCITAGIAYLHRSSIPHKNITPRNVLIKDNKIFVTDFDLSLDWSEVSKIVVDLPRARFRNYVAPEVWDESERGFASDMWPLGCVFLDMVTILKGISLREKLQFFRSNGSNGRNPRDNYDAYLLWIRELRKLKPDQDNSPLLWTEQLILMNSDERGTADELLFSIINCEDEEEGYMYHCPSCDDDFWSQYPVMSVPTGIEPGNDNTGTVPGREKVQSLDEGLCYSVAYGDDKNVLRWLRRWEKRVDSSTDMPSCKALHIAAQRGRTNILEELIKCGFDVNSKIDGRTPLHEATFGSQWEALLRPLKQDADPNIVDHNQETALTAATNVGYTKIVSQLLMNGADVNAVGSFGETALHQAVFRSHTHIVRLLLQQPGINPSKWDDRGYTPLMVAVAGCSEFVVELLLAHSTDAEVHGLITREIQPPPLLVAAKSGSAGIVRKLIARGARVNLQSRACFGQTPVHLASHRGDLEVLEAMFEGPVEPDVQDGYRQTALHVAVVEGHGTLVPLLQRKGFDVEKEDARNVRPLGLAFQKGDLDMANVLVGQGADINCMPFAGQRYQAYLHVAARDPMGLPVLDFLIQRGASIDLYNSNQETALMLAAMEGNCDCILRLIQAGANVDVRGPRQSTAACFASSYGRQEALQLLLDNGANHQVQTSGSRNLLHIAALGGSVPVTKLLLSIGVSMTARDETGDTPLDIGIYLSHEDLVALLEGPTTEDQEEVEIRHELVRKGRAELVAHSLVI